MYTSIIPAVNVGYTAVTTLASVRCTAVIPAASRGYTPITPEASRGYTAVTTPASARCTAVIPEASRGYTPIIPAASVWCMTVFSATIVGQTHTSNPSLWEVEAGRSGV